MSRLRPNWLLGLKTNLKGVTSSELLSCKLQVFRNGQLLTEGRDYAYTDGTYVDFLIDIYETDVILLVDPSIAAFRCILGGSTVSIEEEEIPVAETPVGPSIEEEDEAAEAEPLDGEVTGRPINPEDED